jgi:hypothetical protein
VAGTTLGFLKFVLGFDTISFKKGMTQAERDLVVFQKKVAKFGKGMTDLGAKMSLAITAPLVAFAASGIKEATETADAMGQVNAVLKSMGPVAGKTAAELEKAASAFELHSLYESDQVLRQVTANMLSFGNISKDAFDKAQQAAIDMAARLGTDLQSATILVGKALNDPVKGLSALRRVGVAFTADQIKVIKSLVATGQTAKAQAIILNELAREFGGAAQAAQDADPYNQLIDAYKQLAEQVGTVLLPYLKQFADKLIELLKAFQALNPETQAWIGYAVIAAGVLGPLLVVTGKLVSALAKCAPLMAVFGAASAEAAPGIAAAEVAAAPLGVTLGIVAGAAVIAYGAFKNWDKITPILSDVNLGIKEVEGTAVHFGELSWGERAGQQLGFLILKIREVDADLAAMQRAADATDSAIATFATNSWQSFVRWYDRTQVIFDKLKKKIHDALVGGLDSAWKTLTSNLDWVTGKFQQMANAIVLHSIVPDMVDAIGHHVGRLQKEMVDPVTKATKAATDAFKKMKGEVASLMDRLFPEEASWRQFTDELKLIDNAVKAHVLTEEKAAAAAHRLMTELGGDPLKDLHVEIQDGFDPTEPIVPEDEARTSLEDIKALNKDATTEMIQQWGDLASSAIGSMRSMVDAFKSGDILGGIQLVLDTVLKVMTSLAKMGVFGTSIPGFGGGLAAGGPMVPGKTYLVGERGPEFVTPKRKGYVHPNGSSAEPQRVVVVPSPYFDVVVDHRAANVAAPMAGKAAVIGVTGSEARMVRRSRRNLLAA